MWTKVIRWEVNSWWCHRGPCYGIHRAKVMSMSLHVATVSMQVRNVYCSMRLYNTTRSKCARSTFVEAAICRNGFGTRLLSSRGIWIDWLITAPSVVNSHWLETLWTQRGRSKLHHWVTLGHGTNTHIRCSYPMMNLITQYGLCGLVLLLGLGLGLILYCRIWRPLICVRSSLFLANAPLGEGTWHPVLSPFPSVWSPPRNAACWQGLLSLWHTPQATCETLLSAMHF